MFNRFLVLAVVLSNLLLGGCVVLLSKNAPQGTKVTDEQMSSFVDNKTTENEVSAILGQPNEKTGLATKEVWTYKWEQSTEYLDATTIRKTKTTHEVVEFEFSSNEILLHHRKTAFLTDIRS